jgi:hypothetical protein
MSRAVRVVTSVAVASMLGAASLLAQSSATASINAIAHVSGIAPLTAAGVNDLNFGVVTAGTPKAPTSLPADAGRFNISGEPSSAVTVGFALPAVLTGVGGATIPITFGNADGLQWTTYPSAFVSFNPNAAYFTGLNTAGNLTIGIAGTVSPPLGTVTGNYTGTVSLTVTY